MTGEDPSDLGSKRPGRLEDPLFVVGPSKERSLQTRTREVAGKRFKYEKLLWLEKRNKRVGNFIIDEGHQRYEYYRVIEENLEG